jgi:NIMA (never in mitosis gene a)-related kinase
MENYEMLNEEFGQGSYGKVSLVRHKVSGKQMVWKKTDFGGMSDKQKQQLLTEVHILMELKHENIVRCYDKFVDKKNKAIYLVMEALSGGDLSQLISSYRNTNEAAEEKREKSQRSTDCESE